MAKAVYVGVGSKAHKMKKAYIGIGGTARKVKKMYIGVGGKARLCYSAELEYMGTATALSAARYGVRTATVGSYAVFAGGEGLFDDGNGWSKVVCVSTVDAYNASLTNSTPTALSVARYGHAAATIGSHALFAGGATMIRTSYEDFTNTVDAYSTSLTRSSAAVLSITRYRMGAAVVGNYALFAGGTKDGSYSDSVSGENAVDVYNASLTRMTAGKLRASRADVRGASVGSYAIFAGGTAYGTIVDVYDASLTRTTASDLHSAKNNDSAATIGNYAIFAGDSTADVYNASLTKTTVALLSVARINMSAGTVGDYALFAGGNTDSSYSDVVDACDTSLTRTTATTLSDSRRYLSSATVGDYLLFAGGYKGGINISRVVDVYTA